MNLFSLLRALCHPITPTAKDMDTQITEHPLIRAVRTRNITEARCLVTCCLDIDTPDERGCSALHTAAEAGDIGMVLLLLEHGAHVENRGADGLSVLSRAVAANEERVARVLMAHGATTGLHELSRWAMADYVRWMTEGRFLPSVSNEDLELTLTLPKHRTVEEVPARVCAFSWMIWIVLVRQARALV